MRLQLWVEFLGRVVAPFLLETTVVFLVEEILLKVMQVDYHFVDVYFVLILDWFDILVQRLLFPSPN